MDTQNPAATIKCWVDLYSDSMYSWAYYKTSNKESAEDLVQETFLAAVQAFEKFEGKSNPKTWLLGILNNKISDYHRKSFRDPTITVSEQSEKGERSLLDTLFDADGQWQKEQRPQSWQEESGHLLDNDEFNAVLQNCLSKLPALWFSAVQLKYLEEKNGEIICQELGIAPTNFWQILHRAKLQLRKCVELNWFKK